MNTEAFQSCTENGEIFSCFFKIGATQNMTECENRCRSKNLFAFDLNDFYNFADRLNQSNFLGQRKSPQFNSSSVESLFEVSGKGKKLTVSFTVSVWKSVGSPGSGLSVTLHFPATDYFEFRHSFPGKPLSLHQHRFWLWKTYLDWWKIPGRYALYRKVGRKVWQHMG